MITSGLSKWIIFRITYSIISLRTNYSINYESEKTKMYSNYLIVLFLMIFVISLPCIYLRNLIWTLFYSDITITDVQKFLGYLWKTQNSVLNDITRFFQIPKELSYLSIFFLLIKKKERKNTKKPNKIFNTKTITDFAISISSIMIHLQFFFLLGHNEKLYKRKQYISQLKQETKFLKEPTNYPIVPPFSLWLNDCDIVCKYGLGCEKENLDQGRSYINRNISISNCIFSRYSIFDGCGGVIFIDGSSYSMSIYYSLFYKCVCSLSGGAIYFNSSNSCLRMICANSCSGGTFSGSHFSFLGSSQMNLVEYLSVSNCSFTTSGYHPIHLNYGNQRIDNTNSSMNNAIQTSGIILSSFSSSTSSHCTFSNNKVSQCICIFFYFGSETISMSYANIVHNNSPSGGVVFVGGASIMMIYCILHNNHNVLFDFWGGYIMVSHSFIDHSSSFSTGFNVLTSNNNSFTYRITYQLQFFDSLYCNSDIPFNTPLSTIEQIPLNSPTFEMTEINTPHLTPYRSFGEPDPHLTLFPKQTQFQSLFPEPTPPQSLFPEPTPPQSLFPEHTPFHTHNQERTNQRSFPLDFNEISPSISNIQSNNNLNGNKSNSVFMYSTGVLFIIIVAIISYNLGDQKIHNTNNCSSSSSSLRKEKKPKREENWHKKMYDGNDYKRDYQMNCQDCAASSPYVF